MERIETIKQRLQDTEAEYLAHIIVCELDEIDYDIFIENEDVIKRKITVLIENENILFEDEFDLINGIYDIIKNDVEGRENRVKKIIWDTLQYREKLYSQYRKHWIDELYRSSSIYELRRNVEIRDEIRAVNAQAKIDEITGTIDWLNVSIKLDTLEKELKINEEELVSLGLKLLF